MMSILYFPLKYLCKILGTNELGLDLGFGPDGSDPTSVAMKQRLTWGTQCVGDLCFPSATFLGKIFETLGFDGIYQLALNWFGSTRECEGRLLPGSCTPITSIAWLVKRFVAGG